MTRYREESVLDELTERLVRIHLNRGASLPGGEIFSNSGEGRLLIYLLQDKTNVLIGEMTRDLNLSTGRAANLLRQLETKRYIQRIQCSDDRRKYTVSLTEEGRKKAESIYRGIQVYDRSLLEKLGEEDAGSLVRILEKSIGILQNS